MAENSYAQLIDDFENGINVLKGETLTEYIKRMGGVDYESKADGGRVGMLSGGLLKVGIMKAVEQIKDMDEGNLFSTLDPLGKARTIRDALLDRIDGFKEMIKDLKTQAMDHPEIEDIKFEMDEAKDGLKKINEYIKNQPTNRTLQADGGAIGIEVLFKKKNGGSINSPKSKNIKGQDHMLAYITPNEAKKLEALGGKETMTKEGIPAYPEWDSMYGASSKASFDAGNAPKGNWSGGGDGGNNNPPVIIPKKKPPVVSKDDNPPWYTPGKLINNPLLNFIDPRSKIGMGLNLFKTLKNFQPTEEDVTLGQTSEVISNLPSENLFAEVTQQDIDRKRQMKNLDFNTAKDIGVASPGLTEFEFEGIKSGDITEPGTYVGADGGRVGFNQGGWADGLEGEAKGIYDSMTAYGASDAEIQAKLQAQNLWSPDGTTTDTEQVTGIINQDIGGGGGGIGELDLTFTEGATAKAPATFQGDYDIYGNKINELGRTGILGAWDKTKDFFSNLSTPKVRGTLGTRLSNQPRLPLPASMASWSLSPFNEKSKNYNENFVDQLNFLETQDGMIGRDQGSGLLKYGSDSVLAGKNVISLFGTNDYEEMLKDYLAKMEANEKISAAGKAAKIAKAQAELAALLASQNKSGDGSGTTGGTTSGDGWSGADWGNNPGGEFDTTSSNAGTSEGWSNADWGSGTDEYGSLAKGGLATMFTRRR